ADAMCCDGSLPYPCSAANRVYLITAAARMWGKPACGIPYLLDNFGESGRSHPVVRLPAETSPALLQRPDLQPRRVSRVRKPNLEARARADWDRGTTAGQTADQGFDRISKERRQAATGARSAPRRRIPERLVGAPGPMAYIKIPCRSASLTSSISELTPSLSLMSEWRLATVLGLR